MSCCGGRVQEPEIIVVPHPDKMSDEPFTEWLSTVNPPATVPPGNRLLEIQLPSQVGSKVTFQPTIDGFFDQEQERLVLLMNLPGFVKDEIDVEVGDGLMTISGPKPKSELKEKYGDNIHLYFRERPYGFFYRAFKLPPNALENTVHAGLQNGLLEVTVKCMQSTARTQVFIGDEVPTQAPEETQP